MQVWFNGRTSAFQAEYVGSIPITCFALKTRKSNALRVFLSLKKRVIASNNAITPPPLVREVRSRTFYSLFPCPAPYVSSDHNVS